MPRRKLLTKRELIARLLDGPFSVQRDGLVLWYRLTMAADHEQKNAVVIALAPEHGFLVNEYDVESAYAVVNGRIARLTRWEADAIASRLRSKLRVHAGPISKRDYRRYPRSSSGRQRRVA